jgi:uncharacterized membrane protein
MNDKDLLKFIEKLIINMPINEIWLDNEINKLNKSMNKDSVRKKLIELDLLKETNDNFDELTPRGIKLKELKTFKKLINSETPNFWTKNKNVINAIIGFFVIIGVIFPIYLHFTSKDLKDSENTESLNPINSIEQSTNTHTKDTVSKSIDILQSKN